MNREKGPSYIVQNARGSFSEHTAVHIQQEWFRLLLHRDGRGFVVTTCRLHRHRNWHVRYIRLAAQHFHHSTIEFITFTTKNVLNYYISSTESQMTLKGYHQWLELWSWHNNLQTEKTSQLVSEPAGGWWFLPSTYIAQPIGTYRPQTRDCGDITHIDKVYSQVLLTQLVAAQFFKQSNSGL